MTWICPNCRREFKNTNQWHSCVRVDLQDHLRNKSTEVKAAFHKLIEGMKAFGEMSIEPVKTSVLIKAESTFLYLTLKRDHIDLQFQMAVETDDFPVYQTIRISKNRVLHRAVIENPLDVDSKLLDWLEEAYELSGGKRR